MDLPDSVLPLLPWAIPGAVAIVLGWWLIVRRGRQLADESGPPGVLIPEGEKAVDRLRREAGSLAGFLGRAILVTVLAGGVTAVGYYGYQRLIGEGRPPGKVELQSAPLGPTERPLARRDPMQGAEAAVDEETGERLVLWSGDGQTGALGRVLESGLGVVLLNSEGRPIANREVRFEVSPGGGSVGAASVKTSSSGLALTSWRLGQDPGSLAVRAYVADRPELAVRFTAAAEEGTRSAGPGSGTSQAQSTATVSPTPSASRPPAQELERSGAASADAAAPAIAPVERAGRWAAGGVHTCRVNGAGAITCWGTSRPGSTGSQAMDAVIWGVAAGVFYVCGITEVSAIGCWSVGSGDRDALAGVRSLPDGARPIQVAIGSEHACALSAQGRVYCWGDNTRGQLGTPGGSQSDPAVVEGLTDVAQLVSGWSHTCALTRSGTAYCWGANDAGQLGIGVAEDRSRPTAVLQPEPFRELAAGSAHTCALTRAGSAWCWGQNQYGQLGVDGRSTAPRPTAVETELAFESIVTGSVHTCGVTGSGNAWCWGRNVFGQLGDGTAEDSSAPVPVAGGLTFARLRAGGAHTCGETVNGSLYCWGNNIQGQLGDGTRDNRSEPVRAGGDR